MLFFDPKSKIESELMLIQGLNLLVTEKAGILESKRRIAI
jgi:hypothetical protein